jgi:hypothetical protein
MRYRKLDNCGAWYEIDRTLEGRVNVMEEVTFTVCIGK